MRLILEGLDRLGKSTLINYIQHARGVHTVLHYQAPKVLTCYLNDEDDYLLTKQNAQLRYQQASFEQMFAILSVNANTICDRAHLGEMVYSPLYRKYDGSYVLPMEHRFANVVSEVKLVLLVEDFGCSKHFVDDGLSIDPTKRKEEQELFIAAFERSAIIDKRMICVTDPSTGNFKNVATIYEELLG